MLATVVWLVWVLGQQSGIDGAGALLILLVGLAMVVWALSLARPRRWWLGSCVHRGMALLVWAFGTAGHAHGRGGHGSQRQRHGHRRTRLAALGPGAAEPWWPAAARCLWTSPPPGA
jgi:thiol:disulfide interchange protein